MRTTGDKIDFVLGQLATFEKLYGAIEPDGEGTLSISSSAADDIIRDSAEITVLCDTTPLPASLIPAASALADAAYLLRKALEEAEEVQVIDPEPEGPKSDPLLQQLFKQKESKAKYVRIVDSQSYRDAGDYARKGRELLRAPAREAGIEISSNLP